MQPELYTFSDKHFGTKHYESQFLSKQQENTLNARIRHQQKLVLKEKSDLEMKRKNYNTKYGCSNSAVMHVVKNFDYEFNAVAIPMNLKGVKNTEEIVFSIHTPLTKCQFQETREQKLTGGLPNLPARKWRRVV